MNCDCLTDWFESTKKPRRAGVYQTRIPHINQRTEVFQHWDGERWGCYAFSANEAKADAREVSGYQDVQWRGLASDPKASKP